MSDLLPRSIRNNNPLNVRKGEEWQGMTPEQNDDDFITFVNPVMGLHAAMKILMTYFNRYNLRTVWDIISRWAPPADNNPTSAYAEHVANHMNVEVHDPIDLTDESTMILMTQAMIQVEAGYVKNFPNYIHQDCEFWYPSSVWQAAWDSLNNQGE